MKARPVVGILMGSDSDWEKIKSVSEVLDKFCIKHEVRVISAHRTPEEATRYATAARARGIKVLICAAGSAAHLAGVVAAHTTLPVIGIPVEGGALNGMDALLATLQMPSGIPVATVAVGSSGPYNAGILAVQMLAIADEAINAALVSFKEELAAKVAAADARLQQAISDSKSG
jgi:phosphoribosylaminoimidazole carboxylase PurE protein